MGDPVQDRPGVPRNPGGDVRLQGVHENIKVVIVVTILRHFETREYLPQGARSARSVHGTHQSVLVRELGEGRRHTPAWYVSVKRTNVGTRRTR